MIIIILCLFIYIYILKQLIIIELNPKQTKTIPAKQIPLKMHSQFNKIWCLQYDEDSYYRTMVKVNFKKYLQLILSNPQFSKFQAQASKQLSDIKEWNQRCWALLEFFQYLNNVFESNYFQENVRFQSNPRMRKAYGSLRMWIDLERLYLIMFLKLDKIEFQEDRIFFSLFRTLKFFTDFFTEHNPAQFNSDYLKNMKEQIAKHCKIMSKCCPLYMAPMTNLITQTIDNFINRKIITVEQIALTDQCKKTAYVKLTRQYQLIPEVQMRLNNHVTFQKKKGQLLQIEKIVNSQIIKQYNQSVREVYDPTFRIKNNYITEAKINNQPIDQQKMQQFLDQYHLKMKMKTVNQTPYQGLIRVGHNPYEDSNFLLYGDHLGIDMKKKSQIQKQQEVEQIIEEPTQNQPSYSKQYIQQVLSLPKNNTKITDSDLNKKVIQRDKETKYRAMQGKLSNTKWDNFMDMPAGSTDKDKVMNMAALSTIQSINAEKDLSKNTLFRKQEDIKQEEQQERSIILMKYFRKGINSDTLLHTQVRAQKLYLSKDMTSGCGQLMLSIKHKCTVDRHKFDSLRKVINLSQIMGKMNKWIYQQKVPSFYPRGIQQIRQYPSNPMITQIKKQQAVHQTLETYYQQQLQQRQQQQQQQQ